MKGVISVGLTANTFAALPPCGATLSGTTAFVSTPAGLWRCSPQGSHWLWQAIPCTADLGGTVAYESDVPQLWACVGAQWQPVTLPPCPPGPQGVPGPASLVATAAEPPGPNCVSGGTRVDVGADANGNGVLDPSEVQRTAYVCNGLPADDAPCISGALHCAAQQPQQCDASNTWQDTGPSCTSLDQACVAGACVGVCAPGTKRCLGNGVQTCGPNGEWGTPLSCTTGVAHGTATCTDGACSGFACDAGYTLCGSSCDDLTSDSDNCGACGHGCQGGACNAGLCPAVTLATLSWVPQGIALDASNVYWTQLDNTGTNGSVWKVPVGGGAPVALVSAGLLSPHGIAVDGTNVYWTNEGSAVGTGTIMSIPIVGGAAATIASGLGVPLGIAVAGSRVSWTDRDVPSTGFGPVLSMAAGGGAVTTLASGQKQPDDIAANSTTVFWSTFTGNTVMSAPAGGGAVTSLYVGTQATLVELTGIAIDDTHLYFGDTTGALMRIPLSGGAVQTLATVANPRRLAVDATSVYVITNDSTTQRVLKVPKTGGAPLVLASNAPPAPLPAKSVAVDGTSVYWLTGGAVMKVAK